MYISIEILVSVLFALCAVDVLREVVRNVSVRQDDKIIDAIKIDSVIVRMFLSPARVVCGSEKINLPCGFDRSIQEKIRFAGLKGHIDEKEFKVVSILSGVFGFFSFLAIFGASATFALLGFTIFFASPTIWLLEKMKERRESMRMGLAPMLESIAIAVQAGMDVSPAIIAICEKMKPSPVKDVFSIFAGSVQRGLSRREAFLAMTEICDEKVFLAVIQTLIQCDKLGTGISSSLKRSAEIARHEIYLMAERKAVVASQRSLFPLVLFIMPATFLVVFGPIFVRVYYGGIEGLLGM